MKKNPENMTRSEIDAELAAGLGEERLITVTKMRRESALRDAMEWFRNRDAVKAFDAAHAEPRAIVTQSDIEDVVDLGAKEPS